jgi:hypothetical protein
MLDGTPDVVDCLLGILTAFVDTRIANIVDNIA